MLRPTVLGIDQGTSSTKCLLVDRAGEVVARGQAEVTETHPHPGWVEQDPEAIWASIRTAVDRCVAPDLAGSISAVALSTQRESILAWDRVTGAPLSPVLSWQDQRTAGLARELGRPEALHRVRAISGLPLDPMFSALKIRWLLDRLDQDRRRASSGDLRVGTVDSWILSRFGDDHLIEAGNASRTQLMDVEQVRWSPELLALFAVPEAVLPRIVRSTGPFPAVRGLAPIADGTPLLAVMADSHAALFGHGARQPGEVKATQGTGSSVMGLVAAGATLDPGVCKTIAWSLDEVAYAAEGNIRSAGATLRWTASVLGISVDDLGRLAQDAESDGACLVPGFNGLGAPWWDDEAVGLLTNVTLGTSRAAIARAAFDSIAHQIADVLDAVERGGTTVRRLFVDGGPTRNDRLMQIEADVVGRPIERCATPELSALGTINLAGLQGGLWTQDELARRQPGIDTFRPELGEPERQAGRDRWRRAVERARSGPAERSTATAA